MRKRRVNTSNSREIGRIHGSSSTVVINAQGARISFRFAESNSLVQGTMYGEHPLDFRSEYLGGHLAAAICHPLPQRALCLGLGIGAMPRLLHSVYKSVHIDCVEANDAVIEAAYSYFELPHRADLVVIHDRAEHFVGDETRSDRYDLIYLDCYDANGFAPACTTDVFFRQLVQRLAPQGLIVINMIPGRAGIDQLRANAMKYLERPWVIPCPHKSNQTLFGSVNTPLRLEGVVDKTEATDRDTKTPFCLVDELKRAQPASLGCRDQSMIDAG